MRKKITYILPSGKMFYEITTLNSKERDLVVMGRYIVNEVGAIIG